MFGVPGVLETDGERVQCHVCGQWYKGLGSHSWRTHAFTADDYREKYGLRYTTSLLAPESSAKLSASVSRVMDLDRLAAIRATAAHSVGGKKRRLESKLDPKYQAAQANAIRAMHDGFESAKVNGTLPHPQTTQLITPEARRKSIITRNGTMDQINSKISSSLKKYYATHTVIMPPNSDETRRRMSEAAKRRGISREAREKMRIANIQRCSQMTLEERRAMFHTHQALARETAGFSHAEG